MPKLLENSDKNNMRNSNLFKRLYKRRVVIILSVLCATAILIHITYNYFGHSLVSGIYYEKSFSFLSKTMASRDQQPLEFYFSRADTLVHKSLALILVLSVITIVYAAFRKVAFLLSEKLYFMEESSQERETKLEIADSISVARSVGFFFLTLLIAAAPLCFSKYAPLLDYPWHLARIYILDNWDKSPLLQNWYDIRSFILPNVGIDLIMLFLVKIFPVEVAGRVFIAVVFAITLSGSMFLYRAVNGHLALWPLLSSLFLFNWIFLWGFLNYLLGIGLLLWAIGIWVFLRHSSPWLRLFVGTILTISLFFCHVAALGLYAFTIAGYELQRSCRTLRTSEWLADRDLLIGAAIFIAPFVLFISSTTSHTVNKFIYAQPWFGHKIITFYRSLMSGDWLLDAAMIGLFGLFVIFVRFLGRFRLAKSMYFPLSILLITYLVLPYSGLFSGGYIDTRIPIAIVFIVISCSHLTIKNKLWRYVMLYSLFGFLIFRSVMLSCDWYKYDHITQEFTTAFSRLPSGSIMFVVSGAPEPTLTENRYGWHPPVLHLGSLATLQQRVFVPVTPANPLKQPITVTKRFKEIKKFQRNSPVEIYTPEELTAFINQMRMLVLNADIPLSSVFLLVIDPEKIVPTVSDQTEVVESGLRFKLLKLRT
jgi:hypothetical protein